MAAYKKIAAFLSFAAVLAAPAAVRAQEDPRGTLFIIGGGSRTDAIMSRFVDLAGGKTASIVIIPMASETPLDYAQGPTEQFLRLGAAKADTLIFERGKADSPENLARLKRATGVFFSGGDQVRLYSYMGGTRLLDEVRRLYSAGGVVGGTSAGAAIMSKVMLTGDDRLEADGESFTAIRSSSVVVTEGFGLLPSNIVIDQHFLMRKRENRLISVVLEYPGLTGIGIDEATAFIAGPAGACEVLGDSLVSVYDLAGAGPVTADAKGHLAARGITLHLLKSGDKYVLPKAPAGALK
jgi:cyanophycinase